jgi:hypothetical protein
VPTFQPERLGPAQRGLLFLGASTDPRAGDEPARGNRGRAADLPDESKG